ncbi:MAG: hypothetical protein HFI26_05315 [Lachnospiraceae bacterium]|nr:hypothetical protein [Lachnospiraceae bacterium]MCI9680786.1 hypothetical protein [Lachnospiraceae bacterium]
MYDVPFGSGAKAAPFRFDSNKVSFLLYNIFKGNASMEQTFGKKHISFGFGFGSCFDTSSAKEICKKKAQQAIAHTHANRLADRRGADRMRKPKKLLQDTGLRHHPP